MLEQLIELLRSHPRQSLQRRKPPQRAVSQFDISTEAIVLACKTPNLQPHNLPIVLWQYGLIDNSELEQILDQLEVS